MAKKRKNLSVSDLEHLLHQRVSQLETLVEKRKKLLVEFEALDQEFQRLAGTSLGTIGTTTRSKVVAKPKRKRRRARNAVSLISVVKQVLSKNKKGLSPRTSPFACSWNKYLLFQPYISLSFRKINATKYMGLACFLIKINYLYISCSYIKIKVIVYKNLKFLKK